MTSYSNITNENEKEIKERGYRLKKKMVKMYGQF